MNTTLNIQTTATPDEDAAREARLESNKARRLRRRLGNAGYTMHKSRGYRPPNNMGEYVVCHARSGLVVFGVLFNAYLDDIAEWLNDE